MSERSDSESGRGTDSIDRSRTERPSDDITGDGRRESGGAGGAVLTEVSYSFLSAADPMIPWQVARIDVTEGMNEVYEATLDIATEVPHIQPDHLVGARAELLIRRDLHTRRVMGIVRRVEDHGSAGGKRIVRVTVVPNLWVLSQRVTSRIFQNLDVIAIVKQVLADAGVYGDSLSIELQREYSPREYCVQYNESDLAFVRRLLEDEGIAFYFTHVDDDGETLVLSDEMSAYRPVPTMDERPVEIRGPESATARVESIRRFDWLHEMRPTAVQMRDYDFTHPAAQNDMTRASPRGELGSRPVYEYPGRYNYGDYGGTAYQKHTGSRRAEVRSAELRMTERIGRGRGNVSGMMPGLLFDLRGHGRNDLDQRYLLLRVRHLGRAPEVLLTDTEELRGTASRYHNEFELMPANGTYRPASVTPWPSVRGPQTAMVVGPPGEEIHVDEHGRIRVQFHWDLAGQHNDRSSVWMRVSQNWAGAGWGFSFTPRVGMEVIVDFLEGNPDRPLVVGCTYNGQNGTPYPLPSDKTRSTIKTSSTPGGNGSNEIRFEDSAGSEEMYVHAQKDYNEVVENNHTTTVHANQTNTVDGNQTQTVSGNQTESISGNQTMSVTGNRTASVSANETMSVTGNQTESVTGSRTLSVTGSDTNSITGHQSTSVSASADLSVTGTYDVSATSLYNLGVGASTITANTSSISASSSASITLTVGGSSIKIEPGKITMTTPGSTVTMDAANVTVSATTVTVVGSASTHIIGSSEIIIGGTSIEVSAPTVKVAGTDTTISGSTTTVSGSGSSVTLTGDAAITGGTVNLNS